MKSKRMIVVVVSSIVLCLCLFFIFQIEKDTVSPNKKYVSNKKDIVHYTI